ncbi:MAG TPA: heavy metal translocating P-type ATPase [Oscillospiraceae bacterium]|nr:heavy metal translocating P-type ATPase [Oscillospiraceae bacterium]
MNQRLLRILIGAAVLIAAVIISPEVFLLKLSLYVIALLIVGFDVIYYAIRNIFRGNVFDENFLMSIATIGAMVIGEHAEGVAVMLFYQVGELFQSYAVEKSRKSIASLMNIRPDYANVKIGEDIVKTDPDRVKVGEIIIIKPGEKIPLDSKLTSGNSTLDTSALTGESLPREVVPGDELLSGTINLSGVITAQVTKEFGESTVSKILELVENASGKKSKSEKFITKFSRIYTPTVVIIAVLLAVVPPLIIGGGFADWVYRALAFLVVSCPCALVISVPLSFFGGIGGASRKGILVKGANYLEALAKAEYVVFDKTGTLTKGVFSVQKIHSQGISDEELLKLAAHAESFSSHPISQSLIRAYGKEINQVVVSQVEELSGMGVQAVVEGEKVAVGNARFMESLGVQSLETDTLGTVAHIAVSGAYAGYIVIADEVKLDSRKAINLLHSTGIRETAILTGDKKSVGENIASKLGIKSVYSELLPADKVSKLEELMDTKPSDGTLCYVGDGINDAPVLARADVGIAMGGLGSDAAIEAADIVIMNDEPSKLATAIKIARKTVRIAKQNIVFAISVKVIVLILSAIGFASMWAAVFADVGVTIIAILNAFRALNIRE